MEEEKRKDAVRLRPYRPEDCRALAALFYQTVHAVADSDYTAAQRAAWAPEEMDLARWDSTLRAHIALVAVTLERYAGFGDIDETGYLDRLYVHADFQRRGIATALCDALETARDFPAVSVHASVTALPFFARRGYRVVRAEYVLRNGVSLLRYEMKKTLR